jgi:phosphoglycolate phosphatase
VQSDVQFEGIQAILFDLDGTLVEQSIDFEAMKRRVAAIATGHGVDVSPWVAQPVLEMVAAVMGVLGSQDAGAAGRFASCANRAIIQVETEAAEHARPYPGVPDMLRELGVRGYAVGIVTRNCREAVQRTLARAPLAHRVLLTRDDVRHVKPDPRHLSAALDAMGMRGQRALMCGDHPMDIAAGRGIGATTVGVLRPEVGPEYMAEAQPDLVLRRVTDLTRHLGRRT